MSKQGKLSELKSRKDNDLPRKQTRKAMSKQSRVAIKEEMRRRRADLSDMDETSYLDWWIAYRTFIR